MLKELLYSSSAWGRSRDRQAHSHIHMPIGSSPSLSPPAHVHEEPLSLSLICIVALWLSVRLPAITGRVTLDAALSIS